MATDLELLDAWRGGDLAAAGELYERYFDGLCWFFRNKIGVGVEDLVHDTFVACLEARERLREGSSFRGLLFTVAHRQLVDRLRQRRARGVDLHLDAMSIAQIDPSPSAVVVAREEHALLVHALRHIPLPDQVLLELYYWERLTGPELAEVLDVPEGTVRTRLRAARARLAEALQTLEAAPERIATTLTNLDAWARAVRDEAPKPDPPRRM